MTWRKTWFSYFVWGLSSILICMAFVHVVVTCLKQYNLPVYWIALPIAVVLLCYFVVKLCKKNIQAIELSKSFQITVESLFFAAILAGGLLTRLYSIMDVSGQELFKIISLSESSENFRTFHGAFGVYVVMLRSLFYFIGNSWFAAVIFQIILQLISFCVLYFVVRKTTGIVAALISFTFLMFSPECVKLGVGLYPAVFYFLLCVLTLYFFTESNYKIYENQKINRYQFFAVLFIGLLGGVILYLDVVGIFLLLLGLSFWGIQSRNSMENRMKYSPFYFILFVAGMLLGLVILIVLDAHFSGFGILDGLWNWESVFLPALGQSMYSTFDFQSNLYGWIYIAILFLALLLGVFGFWESREQHPQLGWSLGVLLLLVMQYNCLAADNMNRVYFLSILIAILAGSGIQALFTRDNIIAIFEIEAVPVNEIETVSEVEMVSEVESVSEVETVNDLVSAPEVKYIPNPLPLPKKHVKKSMGYGIEVEMDKMRFDLEISDEDDFDI